MSAINFESMFQLTSDSSGTFTGVNRRSRKVKYWKMCERQNCTRHRNRHGWVTIGPTINDANEYAIFTSYKHMTELPNEYGVELDGAGPMTAIDNNGITRFLTILKNGGLHEFPADQIVSLNWHRIPEVYNALTPKQREGVDRITSTMFPCEFGCYDGDSPKVFYREDLLARHIKAQHRESVQAFAVGKAVKDSVAPKYDPAELAQAVAMAISLIDQNREPQPRRGRQPVAHDVE